MIIVWPLHLYPPSGPNSPNAQVQLSTMIQVSFVRSLEKAPMSFILVLVRYDGILTTLLRIWISENDALCLYAVVKCQFLW